MKYKGFTGLIEYDEDAKIFHGEVLGLRDVITFQGKSVDELETDPIAFKKIFYRLLTVEANVRKMNTFSAHRPTVTIYYALLKILVLIQI